MSMAIANASQALFRSPFSSSPSSSSFPRTPSSLLPLPRTPSSLINNSSPTRRFSLAIKSKNNNSSSTRFEEEEEDEVIISSRETLLYSFSPLPFMFVAALPGASTVRTLFGPFVELVKSWNLPDWLVHWGHPGNMAVVLFAMGGYGTYLGFRIRFSDDVEEKAMAKDLHPKLLGGMFFFFALGATGGITSLLTSDKPILESPHAVTGFTGLALLTIQTLLPTFFEENPGLRSAHGILGSGIMTLFLVHFVFGLQLGLSY